MAQQLAGGQRAHAALAMHDHRAAGVKAVQVPGQLAQRDVQRARNVARPALVGLADVNELHAGFFAQQAFGIDRGKFNHHLPVRMRRVRIR